MYSVLTAYDVAVEWFCRSSCGFHDTMHLSFTKTESSFCTMPGPLCMVIRRYSCIWTSTPGQPCYRFMGFFPMHTWGFLTPHVRTFENQNSTQEPLIEFDHLLNENFLGFHKFTDYRKFHESTNYFVNLQKEKTSLKARKSAVPSSWSWRLAWSCLSWCEL